MYEIIKPDLGKAQVTSKANYPNFCIQKMTNTLKKSKFFIEFISLKVNSGFDNIILIFKLIFNLINLD